jgi:hypothetical protein
MTHHRSSSPKRSATTASAQESAATKIDISSSRRQAIVQVLTEGLLALASTHEAKIKSEPQ